MRGSSLSSFMAILCAIHCVALPVLGETIANLRFTIDHFNI